MRRKAIIVTLIWLSLSFSVSARIVNIPADYSSIQAGISASTDGDTVLVQPGTYPETINFGGRNVMVASLFMIDSDPAYISSTIIDGNSSGTVVLFESGENDTSALIGFTITGGNGTYGGGISCASGSSPSIMHNIIEQNTAAQGGGGISCWQNCAPPIMQNIICDNNSQSMGGGILCSTNSSPTIINNVISGNTANSDGGGIMSWQSNPVVINSVFWSNQGSGNNEISGTVTVSYSDIEGGWSGQGNINANPAFRDPANGNYHLMSTACGDPNDSPCIDAGHPDSTDEFLHCLAGLGTSRADMGAYGGAGNNATIIAEDPAPIPPKPVLSQNYPNPFNPATTIQYDLPRASDVSIDIFDILGRRIEILANAQQQPGHHAVSWDGKGYSSGIYLYRIQAGDYTETRKMLLLR